MLMSMGDHVNNIVVTPGSCDVVDAQAQGMGFERLLVQSLDDLLTGGCFGFWGYRIFQIKKQLIH